MAYKLTLNEISSGEAYNFGPASNQNYTVLEVVKEMSKYWEKVQWEVKENDKFEESGLLKLNCDKALADLKWEPVWDFKETIYNTVNWYKSYYGNDINTFELSTKQIQDFCNTANRKKLFWANV